uniref:hypothetical protein n=1 Tax=Thiolapillus sp. TaxID=2017437 RepID=UPI003AF881C6
MPAMHVDETSLRVDRKNHWIHVCPAGHITYKFGSSAEFVGSRGGFEANDQVCPVGVEHPPGL